MSAQEEAARRAAEAAEAARQAEEQRRQAEAELARHGRAVAGVLGGQR
ncbi:hypothetical protein H3146_04150 [Streptomyces sp. OF3]|uniref:Uncharacterized protein n=1 Tax=Streptomyces alkaliterrae TaxID=2213162 RepID=A0A7W3ZLA7_9ACTN|nr:hypothetical protein [Streptomyces alkaliterrae]MBB1252568.1 hypothetical protein [Streptomyces alkaliterrae]